MKSKLGTGYPISDPEKYLTGDTEGLDPVFSGRLAYVAKINNTTFKITDGYRSYEDQVKMYQDYKAGKLKATAAIPGTSWHGIRLAVDTTSPPIFNMTSQNLKKFGLCKPIKKEGWHIQPIETANMGVKCNMSLAPEDEVKTMLERILKAIPITDTATLEKQLTAQKNTSMWWVIDKLLKKLGL